MRLNTPIPALEKWRDSKAGAWVNRNIKTHNDVGLFLGIFCMLPGGLAIMFLNSFWATVVLALAVIEIVVFIILMLAANEKIPDAKPLSSEKKQQIINALNTHGKK